MRSQGDSARAPPSRGPERGVQAQAASVTHQVQAPLLGFFHLESFPLPCTREKVHLVLSRFVILSSRADSPALNVPEDLARSKLRPGR